MHYVNKILIGGLFALYVTTGLCSNAVQYSANMRQTDPKGNVSSGKMFVGKDKMRIEMNQDGKNLIQIIDNIAHKAYVIFPGKQLYIENTGIPPVGIYTNANVSPCKGKPNLSCKNMGRETINGISAIHWEISVNFRGGNTKSEQWIDEQRGLSVRQVHANGVKTELLLQGHELINGRNTEKWQRITTLSNGKTMKGHQWYDPQLKITIKEQFDSGMSRDITNIHIRQQAARLFVIPADYKKMTPPPMRGR